MEGLLNYCALKKHLKHMNEAENLSLLTYDQSDDQRKAESGKHIVCLDLLRAAKWTTNMENPRVAVPQS